MHGDNATRPGRRPRRPRGKAALLGGLLTVALVGCATAPDAAHPAGTSAAADATPLAVGTAFDRAVPAEVRSLPLIDQDGTTITLDALAGQTIVLADFLTTCQEVCPLTTADLRLADQAFLHAGLGSRVRIIEATVDPWRDDPARLAAYQKLFGAEPNWSFVTGTPEHLASLWRFFGVAFQKTAQSSGPAPKDWLTGKPLTYDVTHQDVVAVIDPRGHERWVVSGLPRVGTEAAVPDTMQRFLNETGRANETAPLGPVWTAHDLEQAVAAVDGHTTP